MNEQQIIQRLTALYGGCRSYEDQGFVDNITDPGTDRERRERVQFRTAFLRPTLFRLEWRKLDQFSGKPEEVEAIWCDGTKAYSKNRFSEVPVECESLDHAIAGATGVAAHTVSSLLMPGVLSFAFLRQGSLSSMPDEAIAGDDCSHICAVTPEQRTDILVSKNTSFLRRIREERIIKGGENVHLPEMPAGLSAEERDEMMRILNETAMEDLHTISDCTYTHVRFDNPIPETVFQFQGAAR